jgi:hypothetical protein
MQKILEFFTLKIPSWILTHVEDYLFNSPSHLGITYKLGAMSPESCGMFFSNACNSKIATTMLLIPRLQSLLHVRCSTSKVHNTFALMFWILLDSTTHSFQLIYQSWNKLLPSLTKGFTNGEKPLQHNQCVYISHTWLVGHITKFTKRLPHQLDH